jgi:very-short-patch-repair endonuclease
MHREPPPTHRDFAKSMRSAPTEAERRLWQLLRGHRLGGLKFKRQVPLDGAIVDFVCFDARLIVEVDGGQHAESAKDSERDKRLATLGFKMLRVWNNEVLQNPEGVAATILAAASPSLAISKA